MEIEMSSVDAMTPMIPREREMYHEEKAKSDRRLVLLRRWNKKRILMGNPCSFCRTSIRVETIEGLMKYIDNHADGCELDAECNG